MSDPRPEPDPNAFDALAPFPELVTRLREHQDTRGAAARGERLAAAVASKSSAELLQMRMDDETADKLVEVLEFTRESLATRLELVDSALLRLLWWAEATEGKTRGEWPGPWPPPTS
jgi:hypothetical protein